MRRRLSFSIALLFAMNLICLSLASAQIEEPAQKISLKPALGFEYLSRSIKWDDDKYSSKLKSYYFTFNLEFEIQEGFSLGLLLGYALSNYNGKIFEHGMIFRQLPFSIELEVGSISGYLFGGEIKKNLISYGDYDIGLFGQLVYYLGVKKSWDIPGLAVEGSLEGKPSWMRASVGPLISYRGFDYFSPYLFLNFNKLWGTFEMEETVKSLRGSENKKFYGDGLFCISLGSIYEVTKSFSLRGELSFIPFKVEENEESESGVDLGFMIKAAYSF